MGVTDIIPKEGYRLFVEGVKLQHLLNFIKSAEWLQRVISQAPSTVSISQDQLDMSKNLGLNNERWYLMGIMMRLDCRTILSRHLECR